MVGTDPFDAPLFALPAQSADVSWPTLSWPEGAPPSAVSRALDVLLDEAFDPDGPLAKTYAVVVVSGGRLLVERYGGTDPRSFDNAPVGPETPLLSWSMAKSVLHGVVGLLVADGLLRLDEPAPVPAWAEPDDPRHGITLQQLLEMRDGLAFTEDYVDRGVSDVMEMLWASGRHDVAGYAAAHPLAHPPGSVFHYSSGTSNIVSGVVARTVGPGEPYRRFLADRLLGPIGASSAVPEFDPAGTWVASTMLYATARDFARFGLLYLRDGVWDSRRLLPEGWVDHGRRPRSVDPDDGMIHGAHWWVVGDGYGSFWASGYSGQSIVLCPALDLMVVRLGDTPTERGPDLLRWKADIVAALAGSA
ncbi:MAG TPA: serine hydrolase [Acidimicrobiales bacterium]|nr:serine hydrolase [Acidimicrobiales bacterium]